MNELDAVKNNKRKKKIFIIVAIIVLIVLVVIVLLLPSKLNLVGVGVDPEGASVTTASNSATGGSAATGAQGGTGAAGNNGGTASNSATGGSAATAGSGASGSSGASGAAQARPSGSNAGSASGTSAAKPSGGANSTKPSGSSVSNGSTSGGSSSSGTQQPAQQKKWVEEYGNVWVVDKEAWTEKEPIYGNQERCICNVCGEDITGNVDPHCKAHALAHEGGGWHSDWRDVIVGYNTVEHPEEGHYERRVVGGHWE